MSMPSSCQRFFDIPELVDLLASHLQQADVSVLIRASQQTRRTCLPSLYKFLNLNRIKVFSFVSGALSLGRNARHVRDLTHGPDELAFYYNCVYEFDVFSSQIVNTPAPRPNWFPPPDPRTRELLALPPMTFLSRLTLRGYSRLDNPCRMLSSGDTRARLTQLCWLISLNPHLTSLDFESISVKDLRDCRILVNAIAGLRRIRELEIGIHCGDQETRQVVLDLFFCVQPSVQRLILAIPQDDVEALNQGASTLGDDDDLTAVVPRRQERLINLKTLELWNMGGRGTVNDILSILAHCPNITELNACDFDDNTVQAVADFVGKECTRIRKLDCSWIKSGDDGNPLPFKVMEALPAQQVTSLCVTGPYAYQSHPVIIPALLRHSTTLQAIHLQCGFGPSRLAYLNAIVYNCVNLESLRICDYEHTLYIDLDDVRDDPWVCTKLHTLMLGVVGCELPFEPEIQPYYSRPTPIILTEAEVQQFARLERLYLQIGGLTELRQLDLIMIGLDGQDDINWPFHKVSKSFPGLMILKDSRTGQPGYLNHLAGLSKLALLAGAVDADAEETTAMMEWREAAWIYEHWPRLQSAYIFSSEDNVRAPFQWLRNKYKQHGQELLYFD